MFSVITLVVLFYLWLKFLDIYTLNNNYIQVPDFKGVYVDNIDSITNINSLRYVIIDTIHDRKRPKGIVVNQDPAAHTNVKKGRKIYLTITSLEKRKVYFPDIYDLSLRQAINILEKEGLHVGRLEYRADIATNKILDFNINGVNIKKGQELYVGTVIDLVIGKGLSSQSVVIPNLVGLNRIEANIILKSTSLNIGSEIYHSSVKDSSMAIIYKQYPVAINDNELSLGSSIDLYFSNK